MRWCTIRAFIHGPRQLNGGSDYQACFLGHRRVGSNPLKARQPPCRGRISIAVFSHSVIHGLLCSTDRCSRSSHDNDECHHRYGFQLGPPSDSIDSRGSVKAPTIDAANNAIAISVFTFGFSFFWLMFWVTHQENKKTADLHQAADSSVEIFRSGGYSPAHRPIRSRHLAVSKGR